MCAQLDTKITYIVKQESLLQFGIKRRRKFETEKKKVPPAHQRT